MKKISNASLVILTVLLLTIPLKAQWIQTSGGYGGTIMDILDDDAGVFAASRGNGVYLTTDNGSTWAQMDNGMSNPYAVCMTGSGSNLFVGTTLTYGGSGGGVYRSTDGGQNWTLANSGLTSLRLYCLAYDGTNLFAGTEYDGGSGGAFLSTNNGGNWTMVSSGLPADHVTALLVDGSSVYAGTGSNGVYKSTNNGTSWSPGDFRTLKPQHKFTRGFGIKYICRNGRRGFSIH